MWSTLLNRLQRFSILSLDRRPRLTSMIAQEVGKGAAVVLFYADIVKMTAIENRYGDTAAKRVLHIFERTLPEVCRDVFEIKGKVLAIQRLWGDDFAVYVSFSSGFQEEECRLMSISFQERMEMQVNRQVRFVHREDLRVHIGYARFPGVLDHRLRRNEAQTVIYCDLDRFKWFNDRYGFEVGDQIIVRTAALLKEGVKRFGTHHDFIGHIGGDDFIVITTPECAEPIVAFLIEQFGSYFADIYEKRRVSDDSILSMSMAGVSLLPGRFGSVEEIAQQAAWVKRLAKERPGTVFVSDQDRECAEANDSGRDWTRAEQRGKMGAL
jgi:diguanylate cyclase (GGDEF)-like protein